MELLLTVVCTLAVAALCYTMLQAAAYRVLDRIVDTPAFLEKQERQAIGRLQKYVTDNQLSTKDKPAFDQWVSEEKDVILSLFQDGQTIYDSIDNYILDIPQEEYLQPIADLEDEGFDYMRPVPFYDITFTDGTAKAMVTCFFEYRYYSFAGGCAVFLAFLVFVTLLLLCIRRKTRYITQLESELKVLEGGDLNYPITIRGRDELTSLAMQIDAMRRTILERQEQEEQAQNANRELITAISHDLRTPLTSLSGYLEILIRHKYSDGAQLQKYLEAGFAKVRQIKDMSDKLFSYFLVYDKNQTQLRLQRVNGVEFVSQLVEESLFDLESEGFHFQRKAGDVSCFFMADMDLVRRVFGNLFSNLLKYADRAVPVQVIYRQEQDRLFIRFENTKKPCETNIQSTNIGLKTCETIMERHGGEFQYRNDGSLFQADLYFPLLTDKSARLLSSTPQSV